MCSPVQSLALSVEKEAITHWLVSYYWLSYGQVPDQKQLPERRIWFGLYSEEIQSIMVGKGRQLLTLHLQTGAGDEC